MEDFRKRNKYKKSFYSKILIIVFFLLLLILAKSTWGVFLKSQEAQNNLNDIESELTSLKERGDSLEKEIQRLSTERGIDEEIRTKFRVAKEGEELVVLIDSPEASTSDDSAKKENFWSNLWPF